MEVYLAQKPFYNQLKMERFLCGMQLKSIVSGFEAVWSIKKLDIYLHQVGIVHIRMIAQIVASTLSSLTIRSVDDTTFSYSNPSYPILEEFFGQCRRMD